MRSRVVTAAAAAATSAAGLAPVAGQCQWERFPAPWITGDIHDLKGVDGVAPDDVWAVGTYVDPSTTYQRLKYIAHLDGAEWRLVDVPNIGKNWNELLDVITVSPEEAYAAGNRNDATGKSRAQFLTWDGSRWEQVPIPPQTGGDSIADLALVDGSVWVAGTRGGASIAEPSNVALAGWYDGEGFVFEHVPWITLPEGRAHNNLRAIDGVAADDLWAVGWAQGATGPIVGWAYVVHRGPGGWEAEDHIFGDPKQDSALNDVLALASDDVWAVGYTGKLPMIAHWDGSGWQEEDLSHLGLDWAELRGIRTVNSSDIYVAGNSFTLDSSGRYGIASPLVLHYDGAAWSIMETATAGKPYDRFFGLGVIPGGDIWAVGNLVEPATGLAPPLTERLSCGGSVCRADLDGDGALTFFDFLAFQNLFVAGDLLADFDGDGSLDFFDFLAFQSEFAAGCS